MNSFWLALQFLTRLPIPNAYSYNHAGLGHAITAFPWVGLVIGLFLLILHLLLDGVSPMIESAILLIAWVWITGNLHIDGLADTADAWAGGGTDRERILTIMKDPNCGPAGVSAVVLNLLSKYALITVSIEQGSIGALIIAPVLARTALIVLFITTPYARVGGIASAFFDGISIGSAKWSIFLACLMGVLIAGWQGIVAIIVGAVVLWLWRASMLKRIGGLTGDTLGATVEILESILLLVIYFAAYK